MNINTSIIRKIIREEIEKLETTDDRVKDTSLEDVAPGDLADTLESPIEMLKVLKIEESKIKKAYKENKRKQEKLLARSK